MREHPSGTPVVPGWPSTEIGELTSLVSRGTAPSYVQESPVRVIGQRCVQESGFQPAAARPQDPHTTSRELVAQAGDVLLNSTGTGTIGRSCLFKHSGKFVVDSHVTVLRTGPALLPEWLCLVLRSHWGQRHLETHCYTGSTNQLELSRREVSHTKVPVPPLDHQREVAALTHSIEESEKAVRESISKLQSVRQSIQLQSLGGCSSRWQRTPLKDLVPSVDYGISEALTSAPDGVPTLRMGNLRAGKPHLVELKYCPSSVDAKLLLRRRDVLFNRTNSIEHIGRAGIWNGELPQATFASYLVRLNPDTARVTPEYLVEWLQHPVTQQRVRAISTVAVQQVNVNPTRLRELEIDLPVDLEEQRCITGRLAACDERIAQEVANLEKLQKVKNGLIDDLLTGNVRVGQLAL